MRSDIPRLDSTCNLLDLLLTLGVKSADDDAIMSAVGHIAFVDKFLDRMDYYERKNTSKNH